MINEEATFKAFGYRSTDLLRCSNKKIIVVCDWCEKEYVRKKNNLGAHNFCTRKCRGAYQTKYLIGENSPKWGGGKDSHICKQCGKEYFAYPHESNRTRFCSHKCASAWKIGRSSGENSPSWKGGKVTRLCDTCKKEFKCYPTSSERFCSHTCYSESLKDAFRGENNPFWKGGYITKICEVCGKSYEIPPAVKHRSKCCSVECRIIYTARANTGRTLTEEHKKQCSVTKMGDKNPMYGKSGDKHHLWKGGISFGKYCEKFNFRFKESVREKFGRRCYVCGTSEERNGRRLPIHHVAYEKNCLCDGIECDFVPLCDRCHTTTNFNRFFWQTLFTYALQYEDEYYSEPIPNLLISVDV